MNRRAAASAQLFAPVAQDRAQKLEPPHLWACIVFIRKNGFWVRRNGRDAHRIRAHFDGNAGGGRTFTSRELQAFACLLAITDRPRASYS